MEEFKNNRTCSFVTLTFSEENLRRYRELAQKEIQDESKCDIYATDNIAARIAIRHMLERYRKKNGRSVKHWFITERGHKGTRRIHIHGIIWLHFGQRGRGRNHINDLTELWGNGWTYNGDYVGEKTITYISKYITKNDSENKGFNGKICTSPGIGAKYIKSYNGRRNRYNGKETIETYTLPNGKEIGLPMYYRMKIYNDREREKLWMNLLDKKTRYVLGRKVDISDNEERYNNLIPEARFISKNAGYQEPEWFDKQYQEKYKRNLKEIFQYSKEIVSLQYKNNTCYGDEKTKRRTHAIEYVAQVGQETNYRNHILPTGGLYTNESIRIREKPNERLGNAANRCYDIDKRNLPRDIPNSTSRIPKISNMPDGNDIGYECIDIDTGEIFHKPEYGKTYKTIYYEKRSRKITKASGERVTVWKTIRYVKEIGYEQLQLF